MCPYSFLTRAIGSPQKKLRNGPAFLEKKEAVAPYMAAKDALIRVGNVSQLQRKRGNGLNFVPLGYCFYATRSNELDTSLREYGMGSDRVPTSANRSC